MADDDKALVETIKDAVLHGTGFMKNGKHVPIEDFYRDPRDARIEALSAENGSLRRENERKDAEIERLRYYLSSTIETLRDAEVCGDDCGVCNDARAALGETK